MTGSFVKDILYPVRIKLKQYFVLIVLLMVALSAGRLYFFLKYRDEFDGISALDVLGAFVNGLRFDLSTAGLFAAPVMLVLFLPFVARSAVVVKALVLVLLAWYVILIGYNFIDIQYYDFAQRHLTFELGNTWQDTGIIFKIGMREYLPELIGFIVFVLVFAYVFVRLTGELRALPVKRRDGFVAGTALDALSLIAVVALTVVFVRGGVQMKPLSIKNAFTTERVELGVLALNGIYSTFNTLYNTKNDKALYDRLLSMRFERELDVTGLIVDKKSEEVVAGYPLFRKLKYADSERRPLNVVVFIMESWSAKFMGSLGASIDAAPFFSTLSKDGLLLTNCLANAQRSYEGLTASLGSIPTWKGMAIDQGGLLYQTRLVPTAAAIKSYGYDTIFVHGARQGSLGFDFLVKRLGFTRHISRDDFAGIANADDGVWGIYDEHAFLRAHEEFLKAERPFFAVIYSLTSHTPYRVPSKEFEHFGPDIEYRDFLNSMRYSDYALSRFFDEARKSRYFKDTLFVVLADHTEGRSTGESVYESYRIPCLFYGPGIRPAAKDLMVSQLDIMPTILDILKVPTPYTSWGKSVFADGERKALLPRGDDFVWISGPHMLVTDLNTHAAIYEYKTGAKAELVGMDSEKARLKDELLQYLKFSYGLIMENRVSPLK